MGHSDKWKKLGRGVSIQVEWVLSLRFSGKESPGVRYRLFAARVQSLSEILMKWSVDVVCMVVRR